MKLLWITNVLFPEMAQAMGEPATHIAGWAKAAADILLKYYPDIKLAVASPYEKCSKVICKEINGVVYYCVPTNKLKYDKNLETVWRNLRDEFQPEVVHLHGTEFAHGLAFLRACGANNVVISIQGLVSAYRRYETAGINLADYCRHASIRHILKGEFSMKKRAKFEVPIIKEGKHFIGRTDWDKAHVWALHPDAYYYFCNETLRKPFYSAKWDVTKCERHRIFLSQAAQPLKGLHKVLMALPLILRHYPDTIIYATGGNLLKYDTLKDKLKTSTYANIIRKMIKQLDIDNRLVFIGSKPADEMVEQLLKANVFICPSSIENSPNSLGEAQLVGTPTVSAYVGGVPDMVEHSKTGLMYRFEEHEMLAKYVCDIFANDDLANHLSENGRVAARIRHDERVNAERTYEIYKQILEGKK